MKLFTDVKIGKRLATGFGITLVLMVFIVITGLIYGKGMELTGRIVFVGLGIVNVIVGAWLSRAITRSITIPVLRSSAHIDLMAKGDFSIAVSEHALRRKDEMGIFANSMHAMNTNIGEIITEMKSSAGSVASASAQLSVSAEKSQIFP